MWSDESNFENMKGFKTILSKNEREQEYLYEGRTIEEVKELLKYAEDTYGCEVSEQFVRTMHKISYKKWIPSPKHIDAIFAEWKLWKPYVTPESFNGFMLHEIERLFRIYTTSTFFSSNLGESYIGSKATVIKEPPSQMVTTIYKSGKLTLDLREVEVASLISKNCKKRKTFI